MHTSKTAILAAAARELTATLNMVRTARMDALFEEITRLQRKTEKGGYLSYIAYMADMDLLSEVTAEWDTLAHGNHVTPDADHIQLQGFTRPGSLCELVGGNFEFRATQKGCAPYTDARI